ncbi:MAG: hypothetical protein WCC96_09145 [Rhodomicrobium sp.]
MVKVPKTVQGSGGKIEPAAALERKKRLADALRRNLTKRKDKKAADPESTPNED